MSEDLISRQSAIDVLSFGKEVLNRALDDADIVGVAREKYEWGLDLIESYISTIKELPSTEPEVTRCKDCREFRRWIDTDITFCDLTESERGALDFCSRPKRR